MQLVESKYILICRFFPLLKQSATEKDPSRIINISSIHGVGIPRADNYGYSTSKAAVLHLTKVLSGKLSKEFVLVNSIAPGMFPSNMTNPILEAYSDRVVKNIPLKRIGSSKDILGAVVYLSSEASSFVTGNTLIVDGGSVTNCKL